MYNYSYTPKHTDLSNSCRILLHSLNYSYPDNARDSYHDSLHCIHSRIDLHSQYNYQSIRCIVHHSYSSIDFDSLVLLLMWMLQHIRQYSFYHMMNHMLFLQHFPHSYPYKQYHIQCMFYELIHQNFQYIQSIPNYKNYCTKR